MKMTLEDLRGFYPQKFKRTFADPSAKGSPDLYTRATKKGHIHKVNPSAKPSRGISSHAKKRRAKFLKLVKG